MQISIGLTSLSNYVAKSDVVLSGVTGLHECNITRTGDTYTVTGDNGVGTITGTVTSGINTVVVTNNGAAGIEAGNDQASGTLTFEFDPTPDPAAGEFTTLNQLAALRLPIGGSTMAVGIINLYCSLTITSGDALKAILLATAIGFIVIGATVISGKVRGFSDDIPPLPIVVLSVMTAICLYASLF